jgi:arylformamidase
VAHNNDEAGHGTEWIDITVPLRSSMVHWPGDPPVTIERIYDMELGDGNTLSKISMGAHTGTHMDAPLHFINRGTGIDKMPLDITIGRARLIEISDNESIKPEELSRFQIRHGERILFKTRNSYRVWKADSFVEDFVYISDEAALFLAEQGVRLVGIDYLSVGGYKDGGSYVHETLLGNGVWIIEGLDLSGVGPGEYELICLPLRIVNGDGAPARAVVKPVL